MELYQHTSQEANSLLQELTPAESKGRNKMAELCFLKVSIIAVAGAC